jgi:8-oxo-dGTP pyrophosphatase MutT (NUDIX family)
MAEFHEYFVIVKKTDSDLEVHGCVTRDVAHSTFRVPHTSVNLVPVFQGTDETLVHKRSAKKRICGGKFDFVGDHVNFEPGLLAGSDALLVGVEKTALREAREELWVTLSGNPYIIPKHHVCRFTDLGELSAGLDDPTSKNVEFSTGFIVFLPGDAEVQVADEDVYGVIDILEHKRLKLVELLQWFKKRPNVFADGATRILSQLKDPELAIYKRFQVVLAKGNQFRD